MFTPQQIEQISFSKVKFNGYSMTDVDEILEPLTEDYITLYKENALLKSKMRVLVGKLEEYRKNEASMKDAIVNAQKACDKMIKEAEAKCAKMLSDANAAASENAKNADSLIAAENARVEDAKKVATARIDEMQEQIRSCLQALDRIKEANRPLNASVPFDFDRNEGRAAREANTEAVANEIALSLEALVGTTDEPEVKPEPRHPAVSDTTGKFTNLQFGRNYDPNHK